MEWNQLIRELFRRAEPYLKIRGDSLHTRVAHEYALLLLEEEDGDKMIVEPAVILHDVGWSRLKSEEIKVAYGVMASGENAAKLNRIHEVEGAIIAQEILEEIGYDHLLIEKITQIIQRHDSGKNPETIEECIVKDADKLWRFSRVGYYHEMERQQLSHEVRHRFLVKHMGNWFFTKTAKELVETELQNRVKGLEEIGRRSRDMAFAEKRILGRTGLRVGPLGVAASFGAPASAFEEAYERGCNYFYWGSIRKKGMRDAIRNLCRQGKREDLVIVVQSYSRSVSLMQAFLERALKSLALDHADILLLGWHNTTPAKRIIDKAVAMKEKGRFRFLGLSGHNRSLFPRLAESGIFDLFHVRYNAAHRGAEQEIFPHIQGEARPGTVSYTATRWGQLLNAKKMPPGENPPSASDCYRFVLSNPGVDVCVCGPKDQVQMREGLRTLELGPLNPEELGRMRKIGDYVHTHCTKFF